MGVRGESGVGTAACLLAVVLFLSSSAGTLLHVRAAPYYEIASQSGEQSLLETAPFAPELYANTDHAVVLGLEHVVKPYNSGRDMQINLSDKSFTVECWLKHDRGTDHSLPGYFLSQGETSNVGPGGRLLMGFKPDNTFELSFYDGVSLVTRQSWTGDRGQWHHWAVTYDFDTESRVVYRDGVEVGRDTTTDRLVAATGLRLGYAYLTDISRDIFFAGAIDEFRVWETVLEPETLRMYASLTSAWITDYHPNLAYLLAYLDFNEGKGLSSEDGGPVGFNAELLCGSDGTPCGSDHSWWAEGVGSNSLSTSRPPHCQKPASPGIPHPQPFLYSFASDSPSMAFLGAVMTRFGASVSGVSLQSRPPSSSRVSLAPSQAPVIECASRRNLKKEKAIRNRRRANELRRMKAQKNGNRPGFFQKRNNSRDEESTVSDDYISPFQYDARGEPLTFNDN